MPIEVEEAPTPEEAAAPDVHVHQLTDEQLVDLLGRAGDSLVHHLKLFEIGVILAAGILALLGVFVQLRHNIDIRNVEAKLERERQERLTWQTETAKGHKDLINALTTDAVDSLMDTKLEALMEERYAKRIMDLVSSYSQEVLMATPEIRGLLLARLRRVIHELEASLTPACGEEASKSVAAALQRAAQDWHTLSLLFGGNSDQIETGLHHLRANPFSEARTRALRLRVRWKDDQSLVPLIDRALSAIEELQLEQEKSSRDSTLGSEEGGGTSK